MRVEVSQKVMLSFVEYAKNCPCCGRAICESSSRGTDHSETVELVDASICLILLSLVRTKRRLLNQRSPCNGLSSSFTSTSKRPSSLFQILRDHSLAVVIRPPCGEYFATLTHWPWSSVRTFLCAAMSQIVAVSFQPSAETSRDESGEKSTSLMGDSL